MQFKKHFHRYFKEMFPKIFLKKFYKHFNFCYQNILTKLQNISKPNLQKHLKYVGKDNSLVCCSQNLLYLLPLIS